MTVSPDTQLSGYRAGVRADVVLPAFLALAGAMLWVGAGLVVLVHDQAERDLLATARCVAADHVYLTLE